MTTGLKAYVIFSVIFCLGFFGLMLSGNEKMVVPVTTANFSAWQPPCRTVDFSNLLKQISNLKNPFKKQFYEDITFKGYVRKEGNQWAAVFTCNEQKPVVIKRFCTYKGVKVVSLHPDYCIIKYGDFQKKLPVK